MHTDFGFKRFYRELDAQAPLTLAQLRNARKAMQDRITDDDRTAYAYEDAVEAEAAYDNGRGTVRQRFDRYWSFVAARQANALGNLLRRVA